ncbi:RING-H2 finger protein ATL74-like [Henckelia pumila]|uniref:RING-H2 finger protein ATL74-like n=1 Tax=Henckelia pumila TaxID=405737 RepID=UPI003C6E2DC6
MRYLTRQLLDSEMTVPLIKANKTSGVSYHGDVGFDSNMVIILAALLCALICALGLSAIVRCARRCTRSSSSVYGATDHPAFPLDQSADGVKKEELGWIPVVVYGAGNRIPATECPICLGEFAQGEDVRILPKCNHGFHVKCIDTWLVLHSSCPTCRHPLVGCFPPETTVSVGIS